MYDSWNAVANPLICSGLSPRPASSPGETKPWEAACETAVA